MKPWHTVFCFFAIFLRPTQGLSQCAITSSISPSCIKGSPSSPHGAIDNSVRTNATLKEIQNSDIRTVIRDLFLDKQQQARTEAEREQIRSLVKYFVNLSLPQIAALESLPQYNADSRPKEFNLESIGAFKPTYVIAQSSGTLPGTPIDLVDAMKALQNAINLDKHFSVTDQTLAAYASAIFSRLTDKKLIGDRYQIAIHNSAASGTLSGFVITSVETQHEIDSFFSHNTSFVPADGSELNLQSKFKLLDEQMIELQGIKQSAAFFGRSTFLKDDIGGWVGNFWGRTGTAKLGQMVCNESSMTFFNFIKVLERRKLLKSFVADGLQSRHIGSHYGTRIRQRNSENYLILDSWKEGAGKIGVIEPEETWLE